MRSEISVEMLHRLLRYEPETGKLFWRVRPEDMFEKTYHTKSWNTKYAGTEAFVRKHSCGYLHGSILGQQNYAHRVIWAMETGEWPEGEVDHEDHNKSNNRFGNLRDSTRTENSQNASIRLDNTSGVTGVCWYKPSKKWVAYICVSGKKMNLGYSETKEGAIAARLAANKKYNFHENHGVRND